MGWECRYALPSFDLQFVSEAAYRAKAAARPPHSKKGGCSLALVGSEFSDTRHKTNGAPCFAAAKL